MDSALLKHRIAALAALLTVLCPLLLLNPPSLAAEEIPHLASAFDGIDNYDAEPIGHDYLYRAQGTSRWGVRAGVVGLTRQRPSSSVLFVNPLAPTENLKGSDFDFGYTTGLDVSVMRRFDQWPDVEFRYMGADAWNAGASAVTTGALVRINTVPPTFVAPGARSINATYSSDLDSFELNLRSDPRGSHIWMFGIRHIELDDTFHANLVDGAAPTVTYDTVTQNRLYGIQVGVETLLGTIRDRLDIDLFAKVGVYHSVGTHRSAYDTTVVTPTATGGAENVSMLAELYLMGNLHLTDNLSLRGGYGMMGVTNVVLATDQIDSSNFVAGTGIDDNGGAFYHGGFLGFDLGY